MTITLSAPELEQFVNDQVRAGHFRSPTEVIQAGLVRLMREPDTAEIDAETLAAIHDAEAQVARGEERDFTEFAAEFRKTQMGD